MPTVRLPLVTKLCTKCGETKPVECFAKRTGVASGLQSKCRDCGRKYKQANREKILEQGRIYREANKEQIALGIKRWEEKNRDRVRAKWRRWEALNKDRRREMRRAAIQANPVAHWAKRSSYINKNKEKFAKVFRFHAAMRRKMVRSQRISSAYKDEIGRIYKERPEGLHVDHIVPVKGRNVCGLHVPWNLQYLRPEENRRKGNRYADC